MTTNSRSILLGGAAVLSWSTVATAFKLCLRQLSYFDMLFVAAWTAWAVFALWMSATQGGWKSFFRLPAKAWGEMALLGLVSPVAYYLILFDSYSLLPAQIAQPVNYLWPIVLLVFLAAFGHERIPGRKYIGMAISLAGLTVISLGGKSIEGEALSVSGMLLAAFSASLWALYWLMSDRLKAQLTQQQLLVGSFGFGCLYLTVAALCSGVNIPSWEALGAAAYVGAFEMGIPFICFGLALRLTTNPALINQMCYLAPFLSLFLIGLVLGEPIVATTYVGLILIVAGLVYNQYFAQRHVLSSHA